MFYCYISFLVFFNVFLIYFFCVDLGAYNTQVNFSVYFLLFFFMLTIPMKYWTLPCVYVCMYTTVMYIYIHFIQISHIILHIILVYLTISTEHCNNYSVVSLYFQDRNRMRADYISTLWYELFLLVVSVSGNYIWRFSLPMCPLLE